MDDPNERTLMRQCIDGICHCDFRLTVTNCVEGHSLFVMYLVFIGLSGLVILVGKTSPTLPFFFSSLTPPFKKALGYLRIGIFVKDIDYSKQGQIVDS